MPPLVILYSGQSCRLYILGIFKQFSCNIELILLVCHAEMNAILNKNSSDVKDCTIYVGLFPCNECAKIIIQSGITEVIYFSDEKGHKPKYIASKKMFDAAGVKYWYV